MKKLALVTLAAVLGTSSVALADNTNGVLVAPPDNRFSDRYNTDRNDRTDRFDDDVDADRAYYDDDADDSRFERDRDGNYWREGRRYIRAEHQPQWQTLGTAGAGTTRIRVGAELGRFQNVRLDVQGFMRVKSVMLRFADGKSQVVRMRSYANGASAPLVIDVAGGSRRIVAVTVFAGHYSRGTVTISGLQAKQHVWRRYAR